MTRRYSWNHRGEKAERDVKGSRLRDSVKARERRWYGEEAYKAVVRAKT